VKFSGMEEGVTIKRQTDEFTGLSSISVMEAGERPAAGKDIRAGVTLVDDKGNELTLAVPTCQRTTSCLLWPW